MPGGTRGENVELVDIIIKKYQSVGYFRPSFSFIDTNPLHVIRPVSNAPIGNRRVEEEKTGFNAGKLSRGSNDVSPMVIPKGRELPS